jgi:DNA polymerase III delta subunit
VFALKISTPSAVTVLMGDDTVSREKARRDIFSSVTDSGKEVVVERFDPENQSMAAFVENFMTPSLFPTVRFFLITDAHLLGKGDFEALKDVLTLAIPEQYVVI